jgi:hypothetical protein
MTEHICGISLVVTCADGSTHQDVTLKIVDDVVIYESKGGDILNVTSTQSAVYACTASQLAAVLLQYQGQQS